MAELWYRLTQLPDLTLNKYASLEGNGVDGVIEKHIAFLRQLNRKGIVSGLSYHLFYLYVSPEDKSKDSPGHRLQIFLMIRGKADAMNNVPALINASPLSDFYKLESKIKHSQTGNDICSINNVLSESGLELPIFNTCAILTKTETLLPAGNGEGEDYYMLREWEMNEDGRLYNMCKMMEALNHTALYRVDLYPVEKSVSLRESLRKPMSILRKRQDDRSSTSKRDYDGTRSVDVLCSALHKEPIGTHAFLNIDAYESGECDVPYCWGIGNIVSVLPNTAILFLQSNVATKLRSPRTDELQKKMPTPFECVKQLSNGSMFCITPDELLRSMNQWQVGHEIEMRKRIHNCLFCGKHVDGNNLVCSSHFTTELR